MKKPLSPTFSIVVIVVALALGALYFMQQYRADQVRFEAEKAALQAMAARGREGRGAAMEARRGANMQRQGGETPGAPTKPPTQPKKAEGKAAKPSGR